MNVKNMTMRAQWSR